MSCHLLFRIEELKVSIVFDNFQFQIVSFYFETKLLPFFCPNDWQVVSFIQMTKCLWLKFCRFPKPQISMEKNAWISRVLRVSSKAQKWKIHFLACEQIPSFLRGAGKKNFRHSISLQQFKRKKPTYKSN